MKLWGPFKRTPAIESIPFIILLSPPIKQSQNSNWKSTLLSIPNSSPSLSVPKALWEFPTLSFYVSFKHSDSSLSVLLLTSKTFTLYSYAAIAECEAKWKQAHFATSPRGKFFVSRLSNKHRLQAINNNNSQKPVESYCSTLLAEWYYKELQFFPGKCFLFQATVVAAHRYVTVSQIRDPEQCFFKHLQ